MRVTITRSKLRSEKVILNYEVYKCGLRQEICENLEFNMKEKVNTNRR